MLPLFIGLTLFNLLGLVATAVLGYGTARGFDLAIPHQLAGVGVTMTCCIVHCTVFIYFAVTSNWVQQAIRIRKLDRRFAAPTRSSRVQAFAAALAAVGTVAIASIFGAARVGYGISAVYHHVIALLALATNLFAAMLECRAIVLNRRLMDTLQDLPAGKTFPAVQPDSAKNGAIR